MKLTKQTALKGALLMVLAANVSWEKVNFESADFASQGEVVGGGGSAATGAGGANGATGPRSQSPPGTAVKLNGDGAPQGAKVTLPSHEGDTRICGDLYKVKYQEIEKEGTRMTEITAFRPSRTNENAVSITWRADLINTIVKKSDADNALTAFVKQLRAQKKESCAGEVVADSASAEDKEDKDEEKKRIAEGMKNCTLDRKGESLKPMGKIDCWVGQLENIEKRVGKHKSEESMKKAVAAEMQRIVRGPLKGLLKEGLKSKDDDRNEHARDAITEAMDSLVALGDEYDIGQDSRGRNNNTISKMVGELSALKHGADASKEADKYKADAKDVRDNLRTARQERDARYQEALRNPLDPWAQSAYQNANDTFLFVKNDYEDLRLRIQSILEPQFIRPLRSMQSSGMLSQGDYRDFTSSFSDLQNLMRDSVTSMQMTSSILGNRSAIPTGRISDSLLGSDIAIPVNLGAIRGGTDTMGRSSLGQTGFPSTAPRLSFPAPRSIFNN